MTAIAGVVHKGKVYIGGDSAGVSGWSLQVRADRKVFVTGPFVMGFTTSFRMGQLLQYAFVPPAQANGVDDVRYMATTFIDAVRKCLTEGGFAKKTSEQEEGGNFLVGYGGQLYEVNGDYQVGVFADQYSAVGSGFELVLGALHATPKLGPEPRLLGALAAAERHNAAVRGPFHVVREP